MTYRNNALRYGRICRRNHLQVFSTEESDSFATCAVRQTFRGLLDHVFVDY